MLHAYEVGGHGIGRADLFQTWRSHLTFYNISFLSALITRQYHITLITHRYIFLLMIKLSTPIILRPLDLSSRHSPIAILPPVHAVAPHHSCERTESPKETKCQGLSAEPSAWASGPPSGLPPPRRPPPRGSLASSLPWRRAPARLPRSAVRAPPPSQPFQFLFICWCPVFGGSVCREGRANRRVFFSKLCSPTLLSSSCSFRAGFRSFASESDDDFKPVRALHGCSPRLEHPEHPHPTTSCFFLQNSDYF